MINKRWPTGIALFLAAWYASDSLRHRREQGDGYDLHGDEISVCTPEFMRAAEAITSSPIAYGNKADILINGDNIFPAYIDAIRSAEKTVNLLSYVYWHGEIAREVADAVCERAAAGVEVNVLFDAVGSAKMGREPDRADARRLCERRDLPAAEALRDPPLNNRMHRKLLIVDGRSA